MGMYRPGRTNESAWPGGYPAVTPPDCPACAKRSIQQTMSCWWAGTVVNKGSLTFVCGRCGRHEKTDQKIEVDT